MLRSGASERGVNYILITILRFWPSSWHDRTLVASASARRKDHFEKKMSKTDLPFRFCKIGLRNTLSLFIFGRKNVRLFFCFVLFVLLQLYPILAYFFKNWSTHRAEEDAHKETIILCTVWEFLNPKVPIFYRFTGFTKMQLT